MESFYTWNLSVNVLLSGVRSVELDSWDGSNGEPIITHGPAQLTRVTPVLFKDILTAIAETAFVSFDYPVILSFENHCSIKQQKKMAAYCKEIFGDMLLTDVLPDYPIKPGVPLPSPSSLRWKILIKNKKIKRKANDNLRRRVLTSVDSITKQSSFDSTESDRISQDEDQTCSADYETDDGSDEKALEPDDILFQSDTYKNQIGQDSVDGVKSGTGIDAELIAQELFDLVNYMRAMGKITSFAKYDARNMSSEMYSMTETRAYKLVKQTPIEFVNHNKRQITRVYPKGKHVDSSNFWPIKFWNCGCQMVALNMQTPDEPFQMKSAFFEHNGGSGYILKPSVMRKADAKYNPFETGNMDLVVPAYL
ncbi:hypothetical protein AB6A40_011343, partial [Gnathostoma spinigerum]